MITPDGRLSGWLYGLQPEPGDLAQALSNAAQGKAGGVMSQLLLLCYHYDPRTGTWSLAVERVLRMAGLATVLAIGLLIFFLRRRKRNAA